MVASPGAAEAVEIARRNPLLRVGLHLTLVEAAPMLEANAIPDLVGADGLMRADMGRMGVDIFFKPRVRRQIAAEIEAQFDGFRRTGLPCDHVDAHKHFHLHPTISGLAIAAALRHGVRSIRVPAEDAAIVGAIDGRAGGLAGRLFRAWTALLRARARRAGLRSADRVFGLRWSGAMTKARMLALAERLPDGLTEIYLHPATGPEFPGAAEGYRYGDEWEALRAPEVAAALNAAGARLGGYGDFVTSE
jgi:hopanoid biosynthesis associated protein HpnK